MIWGYPQETPTCLDWNFIPDPPELKPQELLERHLQPNLTGHNALLSALQKGSQWQVALRMLVEMRLLDVLRKDVFLIVPNGKFTG